MSAKSRLWLVAVATCASLIGSAQLTSAALLYSDNFDIPDTNSLDGSTQTGRHAGLLGDTVTPRSGGIQLTITGGQLNLLARTPGLAAGRMRFHQTANLASRFDFFSGGAGTAMVASGGMTVDFDWTPADNTSANWISYCVGHSGTTDPDLRVITADTDSGFLFRNNGGLQVFDNGANVQSVPGPVFDITKTTHHVSLTYLFNSTADGTPVSLTGLVDGTVAVTQNFTWDGNAGQLYMELGSVAVGTRIDNFSVSTAVPEPSALGLAAAGGALLTARRRRSNV